MNYELRICNERCTDLEDRLYREKKLRRKVEEDLHELEERHRESSGIESSSSGEESDSSSEPRSKRKDRRKSRDKKKVGLPKTGGRSSKRGNRCNKARCPSKSSKEKPVQKRHRVHSTTDAGIKFIHNHPPPAHPRRFAPNFAPILGLLYSSFCPLGGDLLG